MKRSVRHAALGTAFAFLAAVATALGQIHTGGTTAHPPVLVPPSHVPIATMGPVPTMRPLPSASAALYVGAVAPGSHIPHWKLPPLPMRSLANTITPRETAHGKHFYAFGATVHHFGKHANAGTGASFIITADTTTCTNEGTLGALYNVGCKLTWTSNNLNQYSSTDHFQDYVWQANATTVTACSAALCNQSGTYTGNTGPNNQTTLSTQGTWMFGTYDTTAQVWVAVVYVNAGPTFTITVYQDPFHLTESYQFDVESSSDAYIYLQNLASADSYVVMVTSTGVTPNCVFISPQANPTPIPQPSPTGAPGSLMCNPANSAGNTAPNGTLSITWPLTTSLGAGTYSVEVYDSTIGQMLGQVQVSLTGSLGQVLVLSPSSAGDNGNGPPTPPPAIGNSTVFDWDDTTDASDGGVTVTANNLTVGDHLSMSISDPDGMVVHNGFQNGITVGASKSVSQTFAFNNLQINSPGQYPSKIWTVQLYDTTTSQLIASQAFKMLGYSTQTLFRFPSSTGSTSSSLDLPTAGNVTADLIFTNTGNLNYNNQADSLSQIAFTTGPDFQALTGVGNSGQGIVAFPSSGTAASCLYPAICDIPATDSNGNAWTGFDTCGSVTNNHAECVIIFRPNTSTVTLPVGAKLTATSITFTNTHGASGCGAACEGITEELPTNGLSWSLSSGDLSWTPVYFTQSAVDGGTASFEILGSIDNGTRSPATATTPMPFATPFLGTHWYQDRFQHADYQNVSPFTVTSSYSSIWAITVNDNVGSAEINQVAIQLPPLLQFQGTHTVDTTYNNTWGSVACPTGYSTQWFCLQKNNGNTVGCATGHCIPAGGTDTVYIDVNWPIQSFQFTDLVVQGIDISTSPSTVFGLSAATCPTFASAASTCTSVDGGLTTDALGVGAYSLNSNLMSAYFSPSTVGSGLNPTPVSVLFTNTSYAADPNPDPVDAVVLECVGNLATCRNYTVNSSSTSGSWSLLGNGNSSTNANAYEYWFGPTGCAAQYVPADGPPTTAGNVSPPTASVTKLPMCTTAQEALSIQPGNSMTLNLGLNTTGGLPGGSMKWNVYAHGANGNAWSSAKSLLLTVSSESASVRFKQVNSTTYNSPTTPTIAAATNTFVYSVSNNGNVNINNITVTVPGLDINGLPDSTGQPWTINGTPTLSSPQVGGSSPFGCSVTSVTNATEAGANGAIKLTGCAVPPGDEVDISFSGTGPQVQSDTYTWPTTVDSNTAGPSYLGSNQLQVEFSIGLSVTVDPNSPTSGGANPAPQCSPIPTAAVSCAFSGTTMDFGAVGSSSAMAGKDVVVASVIYTGATAGNTWSVYVQTNQNPAATALTCPATETCNAIGHELQIADDDSAMQGGNACATPAPSGMVVPTPGAANPLWTGSVPEYNDVPLTTMLVATGPETQCAKPYDIVNNLQVALGTETPSGYTVTLTYTLIAN